MLAPRGVGQRAFMRVFGGAGGDRRQYGDVLLDRQRTSRRAGLQFFEKLQSQELLIGIHENIYLTDHPLTEERIAYVRDHVERSPYSAVPDPPAFVAMLARIKVKLAAFTEPPPTALAGYPASDRIRRYARAIALYRIPELDQARSTIDALVKDYPTDPYFRELQGPDAVRERTYRRCGGTL